ncbi:MAG TPA: O-antigen ligase family protein [Terriglobales bacterium]|nr:O-antigen ligase family protein [Terriglobales bacterium]
MTTLYFNAHAVEERPERITRGIDFAIFAGLCALLIFGPLAFGAVEEWSLLVLRAGAAVLLLLWLTKQLMRATFELQPNQAYLPLALFGAFIAAQIILGISSYRYATLHEALNYAAYGMLLVVAGETLTQHRQLKRFLIVLTVFGFMLALFAVLQDFSGTDRLYWIRKPVAVAGIIYGPYVNHNHYAGLMELLVPAPIVLSLGERGGKRALFVFVAVLMGGSVFLSRSRGGILALLLEMIFLGVCLSRLKTGRRGFPLLAGLGVLTGAFLLWVGSAKVIHRIVETQDSYRLTIYADCLRMWIQNPVAGFGFGTFPTVYPQFRSFYSHVFVNQAHNDYLQLLVETGMIGFALMAWFLAGIYVTGFRKLEQSDPDDNRFFHLAALTGITGLLIHSLVDFNLHIPANAALFFVLCGVVAAPVPVKKHVLRKIERRERQPEYAG